MNNYYDGLNRQVARTVNGAAVYSVYDGWDLVAEYAASGLSQAWLYGPGGIVKELTQNHYYYQDGSGSTSHLTDSNGALLEWYRYDLQGKPVFSGDANATFSPTGCGISSPAAMGYGALNLYDLRNRPYSPSMGRFLQPDPIGFAGDSANLYRYCGNNPVNSSDPNGTDVQEIWNRTERHAYWGVPNPGGGTTYFNFYPISHNIGALTLGPGKWASSETRPDGFTAMIWTTSPAQDAQIYQDLTHRVEVQGDTYSDLAQNCISAPADIIITSAMKVVITSVLDFFKSIFTGGNTSQEAPPENPYASAGYDSPEDYLAAHQEAGLLYSNAQATPTWLPFWQPDEKTQAPRIGHQPQN